MSASAETIPIVTARSTPELFVERSARLTRSRTLVATVLALLIVAGFALRVNHLGAEGLSEDELNKLHAVEDYRTRGLTATNGEHPMLMKAIMTVSLVAADWWNAAGLAAQHPSLRISPEAALRFPGTLFGAFIALLIFLVASELFGTEVGLIAAALWALDPSGISFNRVAKEDTFLLFFFLLANIFWLRGQRVAESRSGRPEPYYWAAGAAFGAMIASKYMPHFLAISASYYHIFQGIPATRWRLGKVRWLIFFAFMGATFLVCNPTILLPATWHEMRVFAGEHRIGHDSYEFMGKLYGNQLTLWFKGVPWYFYFVFIGVKLPLPVVVSFLAGLPLLFRKRLGDGRFLLLFWMMYFFMPFSAIGGKYTRYFTMALPVVLITAAIGIQTITQLFARLVNSLFESEAAASALRAGLVSLVLTASLVASIGAAPYYRLYTNALGGAIAEVGTFFPHDEFYDASMREVVAQIGLNARAGARVASESPALVAYYAQRAGRSDLVPVSLSDREAVKGLSEGDVIILARGRRYFSNDQLTTRLQETATPTAAFALGAVPSARIYILDRVALELIRDVVN
ncbi:MAG TPA: glycosyltransferase family 39 protein [Pyrinomonadaceae bacterium]|nr:glycosyltransferase family 39 protein [Pyrinomonadaceae bacterium]